MAAHAKSVDGNHMLTVGFEGFYGGGGFDFGFGFGPTACNM